MNEKEALQFFKELSELGKKYNLMVGGGGTPSTGEMTFSTHPMTQEPPAEPGPVRSWNPPPEDGDGT